MFPAVHVLTDTRPPSRDPTPLSLANASKKTLLHKHAMHVKVMPVTHFMKHIKTPERSIHTPNDVTNLRLIHKDEHGEKIWDDRLKVWLKKPPAAMEHFPCDTGEGHEPAFETTGEPKSPHFPSTSSAGSSFDIESPLTAGSDGGCAWQIDPSKRKRRKK